MTDVQEVVSKIRKILSGYSTSASKSAKAPEASGFFAPIFSRQRVEFERAKIVILATFGVLAHRFAVWANKFNNQISTVESATFLWPVKWMDFVGRDISIYIIFALFTIGVSMVLFLPFWRPARIFAFVGFFQYVSFKYSFGHIGHATHALIWVLFLLIFLPHEKLSFGSSVRKSESELRRHRQMTLNVVKYCQIFLGLFYSLAGFWKVLRGFYDLYLGRVSAFSPEAYAHQIAIKTLTLNKPPLLGHLLIENVWMAWPLYLSMLYFELFAIVAVFRPKLHRVLGATLILFHLGSVLTLGISFSTAVLVLGLFFLASPFYQQASFKEIVFELPILKFLRSRSFSSN